MTTEKKGRIPSLDRLLDAARRASDGNPAKGKYVMREKNSTLADAFKEQALTLLVGLIIGGGIAIFIDRLGSMAVSLEVGALIASGAALVVLMAYYLRPTSASKSIDSVNRALRMEHEYRLRELESLKGKKPDNATLTKEERESLLAHVKENFETDGLRDYLSDIKRIIRLEVRNESSDHVFSAIAERLRSEVSDQAKRGNLNLLIGISITIGGLAVLGYAVFNAPSMQNSQEMLAYFIPRASLTLVVEVFAYFFLRLYKQSLAEIKHFQNELTNIESRRIAAQMAARFEIDEIRKSVAQVMANTERNLAASNRKCNTP